MELCRAILQDMPLNSPILPFLALLVGVLSQHVSELASQDGQLIVDIEDENKIQYHQANFNTSSYVFGYEVGRDGQFHHERKRPDGVVYGCYGWTDANGMLRATHYVSDGWGYRVVTPGQPVELFLEPHQHRQHSQIKLEGSEHHHHPGVITPWNKLYFPQGCGQGKPELPRGPGRPSIFGHPELTRPPIYPSRPVAAPAVAGLSGSPDPNKGYILGSKVIIKTFISTSYFARPA